MFPVNILVLFLLYFLYCIYVYNYNMKNGVGGIDIWRWIKYAIVIKESKIIPKKIDGYLLDAPFNYPPIFLILLSLFPRNVIINFPHVLQLILFGIEISFVYLFLWHEELNTNLIFLFLILGIFRNSYFSSRSLPNLLLTLFFIVLSLNIVLYYKIVLIFLIFLSIFFSHRHSLQFILFYLIFHSLFFEDIFLIIFLVLFFILIVTSDLYRKIFINHISILNFYRIRLFKDKIDFKNLVFVFGKIFISKFYYFISFFYFFFYIESSEYEFVSYFLFFAFLISIVYSTNTFSFLGEPNRNFDYMNFVFILCLSFFSNWVIFFISLVFIIIEAAKHFYQRQNRLYDVNLKLDPAFLKILNESKDDFSFMSFPPIFDDFVSFYFPNSKVLFHDNGVTVNLYPWAYMSNFSKIVPDAQISEINDKLGKIDYIILFNSSDYDNYCSLSNYFIAFNNKEFRIYKSIN